MKMKIYILIILIIILIHITKKQKEKFYIEGCSIKVGNKPTEEDFFKCFINDIDKYKEEYKNDTQTAKIISDLGIKMGEYFKKLYIYGLETDFRCILMFIPSKLNNTQTVDIYKDIKMKDFMKIDEIKKGKYEENGKKFKTIKFSSDIQHFSGLFLGFGFKFGISQLANNDEKGSKCGCENSKKRKDHLLCNLEANPTNKGMCVPFNGKEEHFLSGGKFYSNNDIKNVMSDSNKGGGVVYTRTETKTAGIFKWIPTDGVASSVDEYRADQHHKSQTEDMSSCYVRRKDHCHHAYGNSFFKESIVTLDKNFFNVFYKGTHEDRKKVKNQFRENNYSILNKYINYKKE
jgi:hypothetical protein